MAIVRHITVDNKSEAVLTDISKATLSDERDFKVKSITRIFKTIDVGTDEGGTQHVSGCLVWKADSGIIHKIESYFLNTPTSFAVKTFSANDGLKISDDKKSISVKTVGEVKIAVNDILTVNLSIGPG